MKKTPLNKWHKSSGANMVNFGEYEMPLWYPDGIKKEHLSVITHAGIFDTSHMSVLMVTGEDAFLTLQHCFTKDLTNCIGKSQTPLIPGRCVYGGFPDDQGGMIDDAIVYMMSRSAYMVVVNSGMGAKIEHHLKEHAGSKKIEINDLTDKVGKIDLQGPMSAKILLKVLIDAKETLIDMGYFSFKGDFDGAALSKQNVFLIDKTPVLISRTGYTGEFGFEIFLQADQLESAWEMLLSQGEEYGLIPCGLAARDSLRAGAVLPLSHQDIGPWPFINNPWIFSLPYNEERTDFTKEFIGDMALKNNKKPEYTYPFVGYDLRKVSVRGPAKVIDSEENDIGTVLTCVSDMAIGLFEGRIFSVNSPDKPADFNPKGLSCGFLKVNTRLEYGQIVFLKDNRRKLKVMIVKDIRPDRTARCSIKNIL